MIFGQGDFEKDMEDVIKLCSTWWEDSLFFKTYGVPYNVNIDFFRQLKNSGVLFYTIGRDADNKAIACYVGLKIPYMFNPDVLSASEIVWCVEKGQRSFQSVSALLTAVDRLMSEHSIKVWNLSLSNEPKYTSAGTILVHRGYNSMDTVYSKFQGGN